MTQFLIVLLILTVVVYVVSAPLRAQARGAGVKGAGAGPGVNGAGAGPGINGAGAGPGINGAGAAGSSADTLARGRAEAIAELEAARDAKYREIRDAELDHSTGKLSDADYAAVDEVLRGEAIEILNALDRAHEDPGATIGQQ